MFETKQSSYSNFRKLLRENVKYDIVRSVVGEMMEELVAALPPLGDSKVRIGWVRVGAI